MPMIFVFIVWMLITSKVLTCLMNKHHGIRAAICTIFGKKDNYLRMNMMNCIWVCFSHKPIM